MLSGVQKVCLLSVITAYFMINLGRAAEKEVSLSCNADSTNTNLVNMSIRIIPHQDPIFKVYGFDSTSSDTSLSVNRVDACVRDATGLTDRDTQAIEFNLNFDLTGSSFICGASVTDLTGVTGVKQVTVVIRVFAYSETMLSGDDDVYLLRCRSDDVNSPFVSSSPVDVSTAVTPSVTVLPTKYGSFLHVRDAITDIPVSVGTLNQVVYLSVEFRPELRQGPDTYGTTFYIGLLGNDVISGTSASSVFIVVIPKYKGRTDVMVTTASGTQQQNVSDASPMVFNLSSDLMGCSDGGVAEIDYKGVKVHSYDSEVAVVVYNRESDAEDQYTALPLDVLGTKYFTVSLPAINDASEFMIVGTENGTSVTITVPATTTLSVTLNGTVTSAGGTVKVSLNERQTFHLAVSSSTTAESVTGYLVTSDKPVAVITGSRKCNNDHCVDMVSPTTQLGDYYILPPADPLGDMRLTTFIIQAVEAGDTIVTRYLSSTTHENYTITMTTNPVKTITVAHNEPCEIRSTKHVMVTQVVSPPPTGSTDFDSAMLVIPPVYRWSNEYTFYQKDYEAKVTWVQPSTETKVQVNGGVIGSTKIPVLGPGGFEFSSGINLPKDSAFQLGTSTATNKVYTFLPIVYPLKTGTRNTGVAYIPPGLRHADSGYCYAIGRDSDGVDNDCDGRIDEEIKDGLDNDGDSLFDEDTLSAIVGAVASRPINCMVSALADFSVPAKTVSLTGTDGCYINRTGPFAMSGDFTNIVTANIGGNTQLKQLKSGNFTLAKFVDVPKLYFKCDASLCYSSTDDNCKMICKPTARKRRQEEDGPANTTTVRSDIWIYPYIPGGNNEGTSGNTGTTGVVSAQTCLENTNIQIILAVLLALLLVAMTTSMCFCCLFRRRRDSEKRHSKHTVYNGRSMVSFNKRPFPTRYRF